VLSNDMKEVRIEKLIGESSVRGLSWYWKEYDEEILHSLDRCNYGFTYNSSYSSWDKTFYRFL
jgi:hypothetical protein